jgi:hypothetical protein
MRSPITARARHAIDFGALSMDSDRLWFDHLWSVAALVFAVCL